MTRILLYCKDVQLLTGKSESGARRLINKIKVYYNRKPDIPLNIDDFSNYMEIKAETVYRKLRST